MLFPKNDLKVNVLWMVVKEIFSSLKVCIWP